ncbi:MAG: hypothetical protein ABIN66_02455 [candidate division WOR-3 bacterium]
MKVMRNMAFITSLRCSSPSYVFEDLNVSSTRNLLGIAHTCKNIRFRVELALR